MIKASTKKRNKTSSRDVAKRSDRPVNKAKVLFPFNEGIVVAIEGENAFVIHDSGCQGAVQSKYPLVCSCFADGFWSEARCPEGSGRPLR